MSLWGDFAVQAAAGLVGVFAGVLLALSAERRRQAAEQRQAQARHQDELVGVRGVVLVTDYGDDMHKRLLGIASPAPTA